MNLSSPITGMAQTGLTTPTFTLTTDAGISPNQKQWLITALGGTQTGVSAHKVDSPFLVSYTKPSSPKAIPREFMTASGPIGNIPKNVYRLFGRKQVLVNGSYGTAPCDMEITFRVPVGATVQDLTSIKSLISMMGGALTQAPDQWFTSIDQGSL